MIPWNVHPATLRAIQRSRMCEASTFSSLSVTPFLRVLVLFIVFKFTIVDGVYTVTTGFCQEIVLRWL